MKIKFSCQINVYYENHQSYYFTLTINHIFDEKFYTKKLVKAYLMIGSYFGFSFPLEGKQESRLVNNFFCSVYRSCHFKITKRAAKWGAWDIHTAQIQRRKIQTTAVLSQADNAKYKKNQLHFHLRASTLECWLGQDGRSTTEHGMTWPPHFNLSYVI